MPPRPGSATLARRLGARVVALRAEAGLTQERLAWEAGLAKGYLSQVESGKRVPSIPVVFALATRLGVSAADVVGFDLARPHLLLLDAARRADAGTMARAAALVEAGAAPERRENPVAGGQREAPPKGGVDASDLRLVVARRVRAGRVHAALTQAALAARLGVSVSYVQRVESGSQNVTLDTLAKLAGALGVPAAVLLGAAWSASSPRSRDKTTAAEKRRGNRV
jgi:transcriptional regulator with XRE-family HTH domain